LAAPVVMGGPQSVTRDLFDRLSAPGRLVKSFMTHLDALEKFLAAASGHPRSLHTPDDNCAQCGAPERTFRAWLRLLAYSERE
jgi:hypothetical protein